METPTNTEKTKTQLQNEALNAVLSLIGNLDINDYLETFDEMYQISLRSEFLDDTTFRTKVIYGTSVLKDFLKSINSLEKDDILYKTLK